MCHTTLFALLEKGAIAWIFHSTHGVNTNILVHGLLDPIIFAKLMITLSVGKFPLQNVSAQSQGRKGPRAV